MDLSDYYNLICKQPLLSKEEEQEQLEIYFGEEYSPAQKAKAKDILISSNLRFVFKKAKMLSDGDPSRFEELIAAGNEGLLVGLDKFDHTSGYRFLTYAGWWVYQRQLKEMSKMRLVSLPIWKQQLANRIAKAQEAADHPLSIDELKELFPDEKEKDLKELSSTKYLTYYFDDIVEEQKKDEGRFSIESLPEDTDLSELFEEVFYTDDVSRLLSTLPDDQATVLRLSYGLSDGKERSSTFIADYLDVSREEVRKLKKEALRQLKKLAFDTTPTKE